MTAGVRIYVAAGDDEKAIADKVLRARITAGTLPQREWPRISLCPSCNAVLVPTFTFDKREFYCLECGRAHEFFGPRNVPATVKLLDDRAARIAEFAELAADVLPGHQLKNADSRAVVKHEAGLAQLQQRKSR